MNTDKLNVNIGGNINDIDMKGMGHAEYDSARNVMEGTLTFTRPVPTFNELSASCTSIVSVVCSMFSQPVKEAENLISICGDHVWGSCEFRMIDLDQETEFPGNLAGNITQTFEATRQPNGEFTYDTSLEGWYKGSMNIKTSPGYLVYLRQIDRGHIRGVYGQELVDDTDTCLYTFSRRTYKYDNNNRLPKDEIMTYKVIDVDRRKDGDSVIIDFLSQAEYLPIEVNMGIDI